MRAVRTGALIGVALVGVFTAFNAVNCASATTITLEVRGDSDICSQITDTGIVVASIKNIDNPSDSPLQDFEPKCHDGKIGTLVITPHSDSTTDRNAHVGIRVVTGLNDKSANQCDDLKGTVGENCLIAKREITFVEGANVPLTVTLNGKCVHVTCDDGYECDPNQDDPDKRCIPRAVISQPPSSSSGGTDEDSSRPPQDAGPSKEDGAIEAGPLTPEQRCTAIPGRTYLNNVCNIPCSTEDCKKPDICPAGLDCSLLCNKKQACEGVHCGGGGPTQKCEFNCTSNDQDQCKSITCDAGNCHVLCAGADTACSAVLLTGKVNDMSCTKATNNKPSCDDVNCVPGGPPGGGTVCTRTCDGLTLEGCGPRFTCDAGTCADFAGDAGTGGN